jgi:hypothetical protein
VITRRSGRGGAGRNASRSASCTSPPSARRQSSTTRDNTSGSPTRRALTSSWCRLAGAASSTPSWRASVATQTHAHVAGFGLIEQPAAPTAEPPAFCCQGVCECGMDVERLEERHQLDPPPHAMRLVPNLRLLVHPEKELGLGHESGAGGRDTPRSMGRAPKPSTRRSLAGSAG